ncbi:hypothetical protein [Microbacterium oxydans]|nr:hypothetical protein [Microbacterium oxydans]
MSSTVPPTVTIRLVDYDTKRWIWVPHIWPHEGFAGPESWADAASRTVARRSWFRYLRRGFLRDELVRMALSRDGESTNWSLAYAPNLHEIPHLVRVDAHDSVRGVYTSFEQFLQLDGPDLAERPVMQPFFSKHLGHGVTVLKRRWLEETRSLAGVRSYGWELEQTWVSLHMADHFLPRLDRLREHTDALARALAFDIDLGAGPQPARARD